MALEPERPIEKLLRSAAKKRAEVAGDGFSLHPATRKLLQGEIERQFRKPKKTPTPVSDFLLRLGPRFAWAACALAAVVVLGTLLMPNRDRSKDEFTLAKSGDGAAVDALSITLDRDVGFGVDKAKAEEAPASAGARPTDLAAAPPPVAAPLSREFQASVDVPQPADRLEKSRTTAQGGALADAAVAVAPAVASEPQANSLSTSPLAAASGAVSATSKQVESLEKKVADKPALFAESAAFKRVDLREGVADEKEKDKFAPEPPVLLSFQVRQAGDRVQFVDADGSVYEGQILPEFALASRARTVSRPAATAPEPRSGLSQKTAGPPTVAQSVAQGGTARGYRFTVTGTNATSGQKVVFTGSLIGVADLAEFLSGPTQRDSQALRFQATSGTSSLGTAGQQVAAPRITGKVVVGQGQQIDVEAVYSVAPR